MVLREKATWASELLDIQRETVMWSGIRNLQLLVALKIIAETVVDDLIPILSE